MKTDREHIHNFLRYYHHSTQIPLSLVEKEQILFSFVPSAIDPDPAYCVLAPNLGRKDVSLYQEVFGFFFGLIKIADTNLSILVGPLDSHLDASRERSISLLNQLGIPLSESRNIRHWISRTPKVSTSAFFSILRFLDYSFNGKISPLIEAAPRRIDPEEYQLDMNPALQPASHRSEEFENRIYKYIEQGNPDGLLEVLYQVTNSNLSPGNLSSNDDRTLRYIFVATAALCSRSAIRGGMDYEAALSLSDDYIHKMDDSILNNINPLMGLMMVEYAEKVRRLKSPPNISNPVQKALGYINANLHTPLKIDEIASHLAVSRSHLSHTFSAEMHCDLHSYILQQKVEEACYLLIHTTFSIEEIADKLCFSSQAHFQRIFKQLMGATPGSYRKNPPAPEILQK